MSSPSLSFAQVVTLAFASFKPMFFVLGSNKEGTTLAIYNNEHEFRQSVQPISSSSLLGAKLSNTKSARRGEFAFRLNVPINGPIGLVTSRTMKHILSSRVEVEAVGWVRALEGVGVTSSFQEQLMVAQHTGARTSISSGGSQCSTPCSTPRLSATPASYTSLRDQSACSSPCSTPRVSSPSCSTPVNGDIHAGSTPYMTPYTGDIKASPPSPWTAVGADPDPGSPLIPAALSLPPSESSTADARVWPHEHPPELEGDDDIIGTYSARTPTG